MASVKSDDIPEIKKFMAEFWHFVRDFWNPEDDDQYWQGLIDRVDELTEKYPYEFCRGQCIEYVGYLEKRWKGLLGE